jgi:hypothetical protein
MCMSLMMRFASSSRPSLQASPSKKVRKSLEKTIFQGSLAKATFHAISHSWVNGWVHGVTQRESRRSFTGGISHGVDPGTAAKLPKRFGKVFHEIGEFSRELARSTGFPSLRWPALVQGFPPAGEPHLGEALDLFQVGLTQVLPSSQERIGARRSPIDIGK